MFDGIHQITNEKWRKHNSIIKWPEGKIRWFRSLVLGSVDLLLCCVHFEVNLTWPHIAQKQAHCSILILLNNNKVQWVFGSYKNALCFAEAGLYEQPNEGFIVKIAVCRWDDPSKSDQNCERWEPRMIGEKSLERTDGHLLALICEPEKWEGA